MAIDQRDITSQLRMMDDRALQQYAAMHKNDPYVFPLAFQESQNRQKIRMSGQAGAPEQPKVADAALMAMTPQAQGISGLPAPNMQSMADGGIAGYGDGDDVPRRTGDGMAQGGMYDFAQRSEPVVRMAGGGHIPRYQGVPIADGGDGSVVDEFKGIDDQIAANMERQNMLGAFDEYSKYIPTTKPKKGGKKDTAEAKKEEPAKKADIPTYTAKTAEEIKTASEAMAKPELEEIQKGYKPFAEQFAQDRARIDTREKNMLSDALIRAGLKTLGGKSQFAMQNISEGGLEALNVYQDAQKTNDAARKALTQSEMLMSQAQRAEQRGARGEAMSLYAQAEKSQQAGVQLGQEARKLEGTEKFQEGSLLVAQQNADSNRITAQASLARANALNAADRSGALTPKDIAKYRDTAIDNVNKDYSTKKINAQAAAKEAGQKFDEETWKNGLITAEFNRLIEGLQTGKGVSIMKQPPPTGGTLGGGTYNPDLWKNLQVVTPNK